MTVPNRIANGDYPDASKLLDNFDFLEAISFGNFTQNAGFETWAAGTSFSDPTHDAVLADNWILQKVGSPDATLDVTREAATFDSGTYAMKVDITGAGAADSYLEIVQNVPTPSRFASRKVLFGAKIKASTANKVRVSLNDGTNPRTYSTFHTGDGTWQKLYVSFTLTTAALNTHIEINPSDFTGAIYIDSAFLYIIPTAASTTVQSSIGFTDSIEVASVIPSGTAMVFYQAAAPTGWTKSTANNDKALRVVSGTGGGSGGTSDISTGLAHVHTTASHALSTAELPAHNHANGAFDALLKYDGNGTNAYSPDSTGGEPNITTYGTIATVGSGTAHAHGDTGSTAPVMKYIDVIVAVKD